MIKAKMVVIGDAGLVRGFKIAGLGNTMLVQSQKEFEESLEAILADERFGIILVNENMFNHADWRVKRKLDNVAYPVVIPLPDSSGKSTEGDEIRQLIKRAIGFDLQNK